MVKHSCSSVCRCEVFARLFGDMFILYHGLHKRCYLFCMDSGEILIKMAVVSMVHELLVSVDEIHFFAHHHCGRPFVSRLNDDVSSSLELFKCLSFCVGYS